MDKKTREYIEGESEESLLITCKACGHRVSRNAETCPNCGNPTEKGKKQLQNRNIAYSVLRIIGIMIGLYLILHGLSLLF